MRFRYFSIAMVLLSALNLSVAYSQTERGAIYVGGSGMLDISSQKQWGIVYYDGGHDKSDEEKVYTLNLNAEMGFCVVKGLFAGFITDRTWLRFRDDNDMVFKQNTFSIGPMVRYYLPTGMLKPYVGGAFFGGYMTRRVNEWIFASGSSSDSDDNNYSGSSSYGSSSSSDDEETELYWISGYGVGTGIAIFITDYFSLDVGLRHVSEKVRYRDDENEYVNAYELYTRTTSFQVGMYYFF